MRKGVGVTVSFSRAMFDGEVVLLEKKRPARQATSGVLDVQGVVVGVDHEMAPIKVVRLART